MRGSGSGSEFGGLSSGSDDGRLARGTFSANASGKARWVEVVFLSNGSGKARCVEAAFWSGRDRGVGGSVSESEIGEKLQNLA